MSTIEELRQRVESAEHRFGLIDEQERRYSDRLIDLMNALEAAQGEKEAEAATHRARLAELERENGELRGMLHALLLGLEGGSRDTLAHTLRDLDSRLSGLLGTAPAAAETAEVEGVVPAEAEAEGILADDPMDAGEIMAEEPLADGTVAGEELVGETFATEEPMIEEISAAAGRAAADIADETPAIADADEDAVLAAEHAVAALIGQDAAADEAAADAVVMDQVVADIAVEEQTPETLLDEIVAEAREGGVHSPVAEMLERLTDETQYFETAEAAAAEAPAPAPKPVRKTA